MIEAIDLVGDLWSVPAYLRRCAPWLDPDKVRLLRVTTRTRGRCRTPCRSSTPRGSGSATRRRRGARRRHAAAVAADREEMAGSSTT